MQVNEGDIRLNRLDLGGGTLYDIGIYCINAARYLFRDDPIEVFAFSANTGEGRFEDVDEMTSAVLRFPGDRLATFTTSFGSSDVSAYHVVGTKGHLRVEQAYETSTDMIHHLTLDGTTRKRVFPKRDQFAPELLYFSECIKNDGDPEPSGLEGLADVRIIRALYDSAGIGKPVKLEGFERKKGPPPAQEIKRPPIKKPSLIHASPPSG